MKFTLGPLVAFLVATGCGPIVNLGVELKRLAREPETLAVFYPPRLPMMVVTRDSSVSASKELGARWTREYSLEDPAVKVKERVVAALRRGASVQGVKTAPAVAPTDEVDALRKSFGGATIIDFKTLTWAIWSHKDEPRRYVVAYRARMRLVRLDKSLVIWEGVCALRDQDAGRAPTLEELQGDRGALLKSRFEEEADVCGQELVTQLLALAAPPTSRHPTR